MKRIVFRATIEGHENVQKTGIIRMPESFRIRIYDDGEVIITTRGKLATESVFTREEIEGMEDHYSREAIAARITKIVLESQSDKFANRVRIVRKSRASRARS